MNGVSCQNLIPTDTRHMSAGVKFTFGSNAMRTNHCAQPYRTVTPGWRTAPGETQHGARARAALIRAL